MLSPGPFRLLASVLSEPVYKGISYKTSETIDVGEQCTGFLRIRARQGLPGACPSFCLQGIPSSRRSRCCRRFFLLVLSFCFLCALFKLCASSNTVLCKEACCRVPVLCRFVLRLRLLCECVLPWYRCHAYEIYLQYDCVACRGYGQCSYLPFLSPHQMKELILLHYRL